MRYRHCADLGHSGLDRGFEQLRRRTRVPFAVILREFNLRQVAKDAGHGYGTTAPWLAKREVEFVVLYVLVAGHISLIHMNPI